MSDCSTEARAGFTAKCEIKTDSLEELKRHLETDPDVIVYQGRRFVPENSDSEVPLDLIRTRTVICGAVRYYLGRHTIAVPSVGKTIERLLPYLDSGTIGVLEQDIRNWLDENPTCMFGGIDDSEPWRELLVAIESREEHMK